MNYVFSMKRVISKKIFLKMVNNSFDKKKRRFE